MPILLENFRTISLGDEIRLECLEVYYNLLKAIFNLLLINGKHTHNFFSKQVLKNSKNC